MASLHQSNPLSFALRAGYRRGKEKSMSKALAAPNATSAPIAHPTRLLPSPLELTCRSDSFVVLRAAAQHGAHALRLVCRLPRSGALQRSDLQCARLDKTVRLASNSGCAFSAEILDPWQREQLTPAARQLIARAVEDGVHDLVVSSVAMWLYLRVQFPFIRVRLVLREECDNRGLLLLRRQLGIKRVVLPRVTSLHQLEDLARVPGMEFEIYGSAPESAFLWAPRRMPVKADGNAVVLDACGDGKPASNESSFGFAYDQTREIAGLLPSLQALGVRTLLVETTGRCAAESTALATRWRRMLDAAGRRRA
jgi:hypothetical protein